MMNAIIENCNTQFAALKRSGGIFIFVLRNQTPMISVTTATKIESPNRIVELQENTD